MQWSCRDYFADAMQLGGTQERIPDPTPSLLPRPELNETGGSQEVNMTRLTDLPPAQAQRLAELECPDFATRPWVGGPALPQRRVAIVSSAGLVVRGEDPFRGRDADYRAIPAHTKPKDLLISHISINFDRTLRRSRSA